MNPSKGLLPTVPRLLSLQACILIAASTALAQVAPAPADSSTPTATTTTTTTTTTAAPTPQQVQSKEGPVVLSPFEVVSDTKGYYSANTEAGTRINSKLEDLGAAISVVTKQQMDDFAMLDINDIFLYTPNTVGTGTYTDNTVDRNGSVADNNQLNPTSANKVRGLASANIARDNFESLGRVPVDPLNIDAVELSRGPNASVFGLGNASGTLNQVGAKANLSRDFTHVSFRADSVSGYRTSLDVNRALTSNLAVRVSGAFQHDGFNRKPSGINEERYNAMIQYKPFKWTTISAAYNYYKANGNRPNDVMPRDSVSYWAANGHPTWDPVAELIHVNGTTIGPITAATFPTSFNGVNTDYFNAGFTGSNHGFIYIDQGVLGYWTAPTTFATASGPTTNASPFDRLMSPSAATGIVSGKPASQPLFATTPSVGSKAIYDYTSINLASVNRQTDRDLTSEFTIDQILLDTPMQTLALEGAFFREDSQRYARNILGILNANGQSGQLLVDVNSRNLDGTPNPYFLKPYLGQDQPITFQQPAKWDTYRLELAYKIDFTTKKDSWMKWLGLHQISAYDDYKYRINRQYGFKDAISDPQNHTWIPKGLSTGNQGAIVNGPAAALAITRDYFRYYVGNANNTGQVNYAPTDFSYGNYPFIWGNQLNGVFTHENTQLGQVAVTDSTGGGSNVKTILKSMGAVIQSHFLNDDLVTTLGEREDKQYQKAGSTPQLLSTASNLTAFNYPSINSWAAGDYNFHSGKTTQNGAVARPFKDFGFVHESRAQDQPIGKFIGELLGGLSVSYNKSNSFVPQNAATNDFLVELPNSSGNSVDYGLGINIFGGKVVANVRRYDTKAINNRNGDAGTIAQRVLRIDVASTATFLLVNQANNWVAALHPTFNQAQVNTEVGNEIGIPFPTITAYQNGFNNGTISSTNDVESKGTEIELNYNRPTSGTLTANATDEGHQLQRLRRRPGRKLNQRLPILDHDRRPSHNTLWWTTTYRLPDRLGQLPELRRFALPDHPADGGQAADPVPPVQLRAHKAPTSSWPSITDNPILKHFNVTGAILQQAAQSNRLLRVQSTGHDHGARYQQADLLRRPGLLRCRRRLQDEGLRRQDSDVDSAQRPRPRAPGLQAAAHRGFPGRHAQLVPHPRSDPVHPAGVVRPVTTAEIDPWSRGAQFARSRHYLCLWRRAGQRYA